MQTRSRWLTGLGIAAAVAVVAVGVRRCDPIPVKPPTGFSYAVHLTPRVFVMHAPLVPAPGSTMQIVIAPDLDPSASVTRAVARLRDAPAGAVAESECVAQGDGTFACDIALGPAEGERIYGAYVELADGTRTDSRGQYRFSVLSALPANVLVPVRVPVHPAAAVSDAYRIDTALVRDGAGGFTESQFVADSHAGLFAGLLADPVYRWRDVHLGFWLYTRPGVVTSYYSGLDTRCGRNPWPAEATLPAVLQDIEVVGVLHRRTTTSEGIEGSGSAPPSVTFRDCAGALARRPEAGSFSATGGLPASPGVFKHEFAHAAFGTGDEYREDESTRRVTPPVVSVTGAGCCCRNDGDSDGTVVVPGGGTVTPGSGTPGGTPGGVPGGPAVETMTCVAPGGGPQVLPALGTANLPSCSQFTPAPTCGASPDNDSCPSLLGNCVRASAWLGATAPPAASTARPNVFTSQAECESAAQRAADHPALQSPAASLGTCRVLCGAGTGACPCAAADATFWIVDIDPASAQPRDDAMARVTAALERHGGTCQWCVETALCVRWHRARGDSAQDAWTACDAPPKGATMVEALWRALVAWLRALIEALLGIFG